MGLTLFIVILCLGLNAVLACAEMAFVTVDKRKLRKEALGGNRRASFLLDMQESPERILSVVQIGITLVGMISAAVSGANAEESLTPWLMNTFGIKEKLAETLSITLVVVPLTVLSVIIGELVPKSLAIRYSFGICVFLSPALRIADKVLGVLVTPMERMTTIIVDAILPKEKVESKTNGDSEVSLNGLLNEHKIYIHNLIDLDAKVVEKAMVAWKDVEFLSSEASGEEVYEFILSKGRTRFPVMDQGEVYGFLHLKEFLQLQHAGEGDNWLSFVRPISLVEPHAKILSALRLMKLNKIQILIVGKREAPLGILTLQDVIDEVLGDMVDENTDKRIVGFLRHRVLRKRYRRPEATQ
ncbi:hemolysin family protein [Peredibacter starrii]|uniref:CNNM domain-containing protein n=1 Tax=Peredibacter starrii TaxID=28202 RepID=A0AAX4HLP0_9BACT|nr:CNNM domain-containing protein [Peredibacter starrii]WPU64131.1 CNNM domain-containing protein [Peredibacter starrii]